MFNPTFLTPKQQTKLDGWKSWREKKILLAEIHREIEPKLRARREMDKILNGAKTPLERERCFFFSKYLKVYRTVSNSED
jgi:hypothetical protein